MKLEIPEMTTFLKKASATVSGAVLFCIGCAMAGIGLSVIMLLALFGLAAAGLALLAAPFVTQTDADQPDAEPTESTATA